MDVDSSPLLNSRSTTLELRHLTKHQRLISVVFVWEGCGQNPGSFATTRSGLVDEGIDIANSAGSIESSGQSGAVGQLQTKSNSWLGSIDDRLNRGSASAWLRGSSRSSSRGGCTGRRASQSVPTSAEWFVLLWKSLGKKSYEPSKVQEMSSPRTF